MYLNAKDTSASSPTGEYVQADAWVQKGLLIGNAVLLAHVDCAKLTTESRKRGIHPVRSRPESPASASENEP